MKKLNVLLFMAVVITCFSAGAQEIIIDHTCTDLSQVPQSWVDTAKSNLRIGYGHTSHGSQLVTGIASFRGNPGDPYYYDYTSWGLNPGVFLNDYWGNAGGASDLGHNGYLGWRDATITMLDNASNDRNVVIWSWCGGVSDNTPTGIDTYLNAMDALESAYPGVTFIYMTGHLDGSGLSGNLHQMNERIRAYCRDHDKILFDFADIESYDPDGTINYNELYATDGCEYDTNGDHNPWGDGNWAAEWITANPGHELTQTASQCGSCAHSQQLNCVMKGRAFWWMMARIAGWDGPGGQGETGTLTITMPSPNQVLTPGHSQPIRWSSTGEVDQVRIEYATCESTGWHVIAPSTANDGYYLWHVPHTPSSGCRIRITDLSGEITDTCTPVAIQGDLDDNALYIPCAADMEQVVPDLSALNGEVNTYLVNCSGVPLDLAFTSKDENGFVLDDTVVSVPVQGKIKLDPAGFGDGQQRYYRIDQQADTCLHAVCESDAVGFSSYLDVALSDTLLVPHVAESTGYWNTFAYLSNVDRLETVISVGTASMSMTPAFGTAISLEELLPASPETADAWGTVGLSPFFTPPRSDVLSGFEVFIKENGDGGAVELVQAPSADIHVPHIPTSTATFWTGFALLNPDITAQLLTFHFYSDTGELLLTDTLDIPGRTKIKGTLSELFSDVAGEAGWARIESSGGGIVAVELYGTHHAGICGFSMDADPATDFILPLMLAGEGQWTGIALTNPQETAAEVTVALVDGDGIELDQATWTVNPFSRAKAVVDELFPEQTIDNTCYIRITASVPIIGVTAAGDDGFTYMCALPMHETSIME